MKSYPFLKRYLGQFFHWVFEAVQVVRERRDDLIGIKLIHSATLILYANGIAVN